MKEFITQAFTIFISGAIFMTLSNKFGWSRNVWKQINKIMKPKYNIFLLIFFVIILSISVQKLFLGTAYQNILGGLVIGFCLAFIPSLARTQN